jgi:predicted ATPase/class 3 adenylate cyclase
MDLPTPARRELPSGAVTFVFTDVEGSTRLLHELGAEDYAAALAAHRRIVRDAALANGGVEVDTQGDAFFLAFATAPGALGAAAEIVDRLADGRIRLRIGIHSGPALITDEGYVGEDVHVAARVAGSASGGQVILTRETRNLVGPAFGLVELGEHRFKDVPVPIAIYQLGAGAFPPLRTISNTNLPRPASSFVGREDELAALAAMLRDSARLVTLTGPGGTGKTRLAIEAAAELVPVMKGGVFWVDLSSLRGPDLVPEAIGNVLGAREGLAGHIGEREMLLALDNLEQVVEAAPRLATLVEGCPNLRLLVTSRERLRVRGEVEFAVSPLPIAEAAALFEARSGLPADETITELCRRLDSLPLAIELAAARTGMLSPAQILSRIGDRLDLLRGGRDASERQSTLRATIAWSNDLLPVPEQRLFSCLGVFRGGWTLEAAEAVCDAELDSLQSLVDRSLVRRDGERFGMLETIAEFSRERLAASDDEVATRRRHAAFYVGLARAQDAELRRGEPEEVPVAVLEADIDNLRAAFAWLTETGDVEGVRTIAVALPTYWDMRGQYAEGRRCLDGAIMLEQPEDDVRRRLLVSLAQVAYAQGDHVAAVAASDEAGAIANRLGGLVRPLDSLRDQALAAWDRGELDEAERLLRERLVLASQVDNGVAMSACRLNLAAIANQMHRHEAARELLLENMDFVRSRGQSRCEAHTFLGLAETAVRSGHRVEAVPDALDGARLSMAIRDSPSAAVGLDLWAVGAATGGDRHGAATILGATEAARESMGAELDEDEIVIRDLAREAIGPADAVASAWADGRALELDAALEHASMRSASREG